MPRKRKTEWRIEYRNRALAAQGPQAGWTEWWCYNDKELRDRALALLNGEQSSYHVFEYRAKDKKP